MQFATNIARFSVSLQCHQALHLQAKWLLDLVQNAVKENGLAMLRDGYRIQVGWSIVTFVEREQGKFILCEPDFSADPFSELKDDVTCTLSVQAEQNDFVLQLGVPAVSTSFQDKIVYEQSCLEEQDIYLERKSPKSGDSGWCIGLRSGDTKREMRYEACFAYELLKKRPELMKLLQLPVGFLVVIDGKEIETVLSPENEPIFSR